MKLYNKSFALNKTAIDSAATENIPAEGTIIPLLIDCINGMREQLYQCGFSDEKRNKVIEKVYLFLTDDMENYVLCIKYRNGNIKVVPSAGFQLTLNELQNLCMVH